MEANKLTLFIELDGSEISHTAGAKVKGNIFLEVNSNFDYDLGKKLVLYFKGFEETEFGTKTQECGRVGIINTEMEIAVWKNNASIKKGDYVFPFSFQLPDWLPASISVAEPKNSIFMQIRYMLIAQV